MSADKIKAGLKDAIAHRGRITVVEPCGTRTMPKITLTPAEEALQRTSRQIAFDIAMSALNEISAPALTGSKQQRIAQDALGRIRKLIG